MGSPTRRASWEIRIAWILRAAILATTALHMASGDVLYALFSLAAVGLAVVPALVARTSLGNLPVGFEVAVLGILVADMTLGQLAGLYRVIPWYDKALHLGSSAMLGMVAFLAVYMLHFIGRSRMHLWIDAAAILLLTLGLGALWEIGEYAIDHLFDRASQSAPGMAALDDTIWDLVLDGAGGLLGAALGPLYMRTSRHSRRRVETFAELLEERGEPVTARQRRRARPAARRASRAPTRR